MTNERGDSVKKLVTDGMLAAGLLVTGMFKIPSFLPGAEFQISAPFAVAVAKILGFKRYLMIGLAASVCGFAVGAQNLLNIMVAMVYRVVVGLLLDLFPDSKAAVALCGPCGTFVSRLLLAQVLGVDWVLLVLYALPGMAFTAVLAPVFIKAGRRFGLQ